MKVRKLCRENKRAKEREKLEIIQQELDIRSRRKFYYLDRIYTWFIFYKNEEVKPLGNN